MLQIQKEDETREKQKTAQFTSKMLPEGTKKSRTQHITAKMNH